MSVPATSRSGRPTPTPAPRTPAPTSNSPAISGGHDFDVIGEGERYVMRCRAVPIAFEAARLRDRFGDIQAQVTVYCGLSGTRGRPDSEMLTSSSENLSNAGARSRFARNVEKLARAPQVDFGQLYEMFVLWIFEMLAAGQPSVLLSEIPERADDGYFDVLGVKLARTGKTGIYAKGDSAKSMFALYVLGELGKRGLSVSFFDFEWTGDVHASRARKLWPDGDFPPIRYRQCSRSLTQEAESLRRDVLAQGTQYFVIDSIVAACHDKPESAETATAFNRAASYIAGSQAGQLWLGHVVKSKEGTPDGEETFFGSIFWSNFIRCGWFAKAQPAVDGGPLVCAYHHRKRNGLPQLPSVGIAIHFEPDRTRIERCDPADLSPDLSVGLPLWQRMRDTLRQGSRTPEDLAEELGATKEAIKKAVQRGGHLFTKLEGGHGVPSRLALVERRPS